MKREGAAVPDGDEPDKKKSAVSANGVAVATSRATTDEAAASANFADLVDELLIRIYSCLEFKERQITRGVCRRLLEFVDQSTPGAEELKIFLAVTGSDRVKMKPSHGDSVVLSLETQIRPREGEDMLALLQARLPPLQSIRPKKLSLQQNAFFAMMHHLVDQKVASSVSNIELVQLAPVGPASQVRQAYSAFDQMSQTGVQTLSLSGDPSLWYVPSFLPRLTSLTCNIIVAPQSLQFTKQGLRRLSGKPNLRELFIGSISSIGMDSQVVLMNILATFTNLHKFECKAPFVCSVTNGSYEAFGNMMLGMTSLECFGILYTPPIELWEHVSEQNIVNHSLRKLKVLHHVEPFERLEAVAHGLSRLAPSLTGLCLDTTYSRSDELVEEFVEALTGLRQHPALETLELVGWKFGEGMLPRLQQRLGHGIKVVVTVTLFSD